MATTIPAHAALLTEVRAEISKFSGQTLDVLTLNRPPDVEYAVTLAKVISKLSPLVGNMIESKVVSTLNAVNKRKGRWRRQDPDFPDAIFDGDIHPKPGVEIKAWFPLATEITARFRDSVTALATDHIDVSVLAWMPEHVIFGRPRILDVWVDGARTLAEARDLHYHRPPDYLVLEPEDTAARTANLQQRNTNGYKFQGTPVQLAEAEKIVAAWGKKCRDYSCDRSYQALLRGLMGKFTYRLDTNYAKIDRVRHKTLEAFKTRVLATRLNGRTVSEWVDLLAEPEVNAKALGELIRS